MRDYIGQESSLSGRPTSVWLAANPGRDYPRLDSPRTADVAIVGAGLVGVTLAYLLGEAGQRVVLLEGREVLGDVSGHTTAKVTIQHGPIYQRLRRKLGELSTVTYAEANLAGLNRIRTLVRDLGIDCALETADSYLYAETDEGLRTVLAEADAMTALDLPVEYVEAVPAPFPVRGAVRMPLQGSFDPVAYGFGLLDAARNVEVYVGDPALDIRERDDGRTEVLTENASVAAWNVVMATHFPFWDRGGFFTRLYPQRSYALALRLAEDVPRDLFYPVDGQLAMRRYDATEGPLAIVSGIHHKAGQGGDERGCYRELEAWARDRLPVESVAYRWSTQDNDTPDGLPYVGRSPFAERVYLATGFAGWGMTNSAAAAILLADLVLGRENPWAPVFDPKRAHLAASATSFVSENLDVAKRFVGDRGASRRRSLADIPPGQGEVVAQDGGYVAVRRAEDGTLHGVDARCTHLGCIVTWNEAEKTWDCPCHGSRFLADGRPLHGPALHALAPVEVHEEAAQPEPAR